jgi:drug/metabolite transporter (DMT)-like permease
VTLGIAAAVSWGAADFSGGLATKRTNVYGVVIGGELVGLILLMALILVTGEPVPPLESWALSALAGIGGGFGLVLLYRALAGGQMSIAAPISAVLAAAIPVLVSVVMQGWPDLPTILGLLLALLAIWLISRGEAGGAATPIHLDTIRLPIIAGVVFGLFFVLLHQASQESVLWPIVATRLASIAFLAPFAAVSRQSWIPKRAYWPLIALSGVLDTGGNGLYVLAGQIGRLDVAAVLSSLYPGATVLLAWLILKERVGRIQMVGILSALLAIVLITI